ncbi:hypothetical protein PROFUN_14889 [Planoprotostelium fungivorum]|uniref:Alpha-2-macroglobulin domain-containing protein n=1 Tax=Planoprotostelium fungivorum TaxID=1890364 RepID=A0A2P6MYI1_9EUKA|nr:hypothetical protein PROFUN_14889 [Planoprotostelium fungivorum]
MKVLLLLLLVSTSFTSLDATSPDSETCSISASVETHHHMPTNNMRAIGIDTREEYNVKGKDPYVASIPKSESAQELEILSEEQIQAIYNRLPPLTPRINRGDEFHKRPDTPTPPTAENKIQMPFPPQGEEPQRTLTEPSKQKLKVLSSRPEGKIQSCDRVTLNFSHSLTAITDLDQLDDAAERVFTIEPRPEGRFQFEGTNTVTFTSTKPFPKATRYTVKVSPDLQTPTGIKMEGAFETSFTLPPPTLLSYHPRHESITNTTQIFNVCFDQKVDTAEFMKGLKLDYEWWKHPLGWWEQHLRFTWGERDKCVAFVVEDLPVDTPYTITFDEGIPSMEGPMLSSTRRVYASYRTYAPLKVITNEDQGYLFYQIRFNNRLDFHRDVERDVTVEPPTLVDMYGDSIEFMIHPRKTYRVKVHTSLRDVYGQNLSTPLELEVKGRPIPRLASPFTWYGGLVTLDPSSSDTSDLWSFPFFADHHEKLHVNVRRLSIEDIIAYNTEKAKVGADIFSNSLAQLETLGTSITAHEIELNGSTEGQIHQVDLKPAMRDILNHLGMAAIIIRGNKDEITSIVQMTKLSASVFPHGENATVLVRSLVDQSVVKDATVRLGGKEYKTDENGSTVIQLFSLEHLGWMSVTKVAYQWSGEDQMAMKVPMANVLSPNQKVYGVTDRGLYRPQEEVHVKCMVRDVTERGLQMPPSGTNITIIVRSPRQKEIFVSEYKTNEHGNFDFSFPLAAESDLGDHTIRRVDADGSHDEICTFSVHEFRKPEFKSSAQVTSTGPFIMNGEATVSTSASYYSGGPLSDSSVSWRISTTKSHFSPPGWGGFSFCDNKFSFHNAYEYHHDVHVEGKTDQTGEHSTKINLTGYKDELQPVRLHITALMQDINRQTLSSSTSLFVHPATLYVGIKAEKVDNVSGVPLTHLQVLARAEEDISVDYVVTNIKGEAVEGREIEILVTAEEIKNGEGEYVTINKEIQSFTKKSGNGVQTFHITTPQSGPHTIQVTVRDVQNRTQLTTTTLYVINDEQKNDERMSNQKGSHKKVAPMEEKIDVMADKPSYQVGDVAELLFKNPLFPSRGGYIIVTSTKVLPMVPITFTKNEETVKFTITEDMMPGIRVQVMSEGYSKTQQLPVWSIGSQDLSVSTETKSLTVSPSPAAESSTPGSSTKVSIQVKDHKGANVSGAEVTLIVVDESILSMSDYKIHDPLLFFYPPNIRSVTLVSSRRSIVAQRDFDPRSYQLDRSSHILGGHSAYSEGNIQRSVVRDNFNSLAAWIGSSITDDKGQVELDVKMPDTLTNYRIFALASEGRDRFGVGESEIRVSLPLALRPSIPRFCNYGDRVRLSTVVVNQTPQKREVSVVIRSDQVKFEGSSGYRLTLEPNGRTEVPFMGIINHTGKVSIQFAMSSEEMQDAVTIEIPVYTPFTSEDFATYGNTAETTVISQTIQPPSNVIPKFGRLEVTTSSTLLSSLLDSYKYLYRYPYGCSEQVASRLLSNVMIGPLLSSFAGTVDGLPSQKELEKSMQDDVDKLRQREVRGGFRFWDQGEVSHYVTVHCLHALVRYRKTLPCNKGQNGDEWSTSHLIDNVISSFPSWIASVPKDRRSYIHMYFLYVCTLHHGNSDQYYAKAAELLGDDYSEAPTELLCWALQVLHGKNAEKEKELLRVLMNRITESADKAHVRENRRLDHDVFVYLLGNDARGVGVLLETLITVSPDHHIIPKLVRGLMSGRSSRGIWANTQENCFSLLGLRAYFDKYETDVPDYKVNQWYGQTYVGTTQHEGRDTEVKSISVPMDVLLSSTGQKELVMEKKGKGRLYYRVGLTYALSNLTVDSRDRGFEISRQYVAVDDKGDVEKREDGTWKIRMGARVKVEITVKNRDPRYHVALVDNLPAGMEALNSSIKNTESIPSSEARSFCYLPYFHSDHENLRDDRLEVFSSYVYPGEKKYEFYVRATNGGVFTAPPAKVEEMYSPEVFGRSASDKLVIE